MRLIMSWTPLHRVIIPWMTTLEGMLQQVPMPTILGRALWVASDYSFDNAGSDFQTIGLLLADPSTMSHWLRLRNQVRGEHLGERTMSWKKLPGDARRRAAFRPFLEAANQIDGLAITLAFDHDSALQLPNDGQF